MVWAYSPPAGAPAGATGQLHLRLPGRPDRARLRRAGSLLAVTVTSAAEARPLRTVPAEVSAAVPVPLVAAGGLMTGQDIAAAIAGGAVAAQWGTAFVCCPQAGTSAAYRRALLDRAYPASGFTRAFTGRTARGLVNGFFREHNAAAPAGYPWVHHLTRPLRAAAAERGDADLLNLWAGTGWPRIRPLPAGELVARLAAGIIAARTRPGQAGGH